MVPGSQWTSVRRSLLRSRQLRVATVALMVCLNVLSVREVLAQPFVPGLDGDPESRSVVVPPPRELMVALEEARTELTKGQTTTALPLLKFIIDHPEDYFLEDSLRGSLKQVVWDLLASSPAEVRDSFELQYGAEARKLAEQARTEGSETARRQLYGQLWGTKAAQAEVLREALVTFDNGQALASGRWWDGISETETYQQATQAGLRHALAWLRAGRFDRALPLLRQLQPDAERKVQYGAGSLLIPGEVAADPGWLYEQLPYLKPGLAVGLPEWATFRGDAARNASVQVCGPIGSPAWSQSLLAGLGPWQNGTATGPGEMDRAKELIARLQDHLRIDDRLSQPGCYPLVVGDMVVVRTPFFIEAYQLRSGKLAWRSVLRSLPLPPSTLREADLEVEEMATLQRQRLEDWYQETLLRNQTGGILSSHDGQVFAVEHSPQVSTEVQLLGVMGGADQRPEVSNKLVAYDLAGGLLNWELGGKRRDVGFPLAGAYFLGPPVCLHERLYCLVEMAGELRLLQLKDEGSPAGPQVEWSQLLAAPRVALAAAAMRRRSGISPAAADDLLICPTTAGLVVAVDPIRQQLVWGYEYPSLEVLDTLDPRRIAFNRLQGRPTPVEIDEDEGRWLDSAPTVAAGRVLLTPRDSTELHCLDAVTGELQWKRPRDRGLYIAGVRNRTVIIVGRDQIEAVDLATGAAVWSEALLIPEPAGRGLFMGQHYLLPLVTGELVWIDCAEGRIRLRVGLPAGLSPGNLAAGYGALVSQGLTELTAFRPLPEIEVQIARDLQRDADDATALALRGELRLHRGDTAGAESDLNRSLALKPDPQASRVLADVLISRLSRELPQNRSEIDRLEKLIQDERQRAEFLCLTAAGFEKQGELLAAFQQYLKLADVASATHPLTRVSSDLTVRQDRIIRGRLWGLYQSASTADRAAMEEMLLKRLEAPVATTGGESLRRYLEYFDGLPHADRARLQSLKELPRDQPTSTVQTRLGDWMQLSQSRDPQIAGYAVGRLAKSALERQSPSEARVWIDTLQRQYSNVEILPGQTGTQLLSRWKAEIDQVLAGASPDWPKTLEATRQQRPPILQRVTAVEQVGRPHPVYGEWLFEFVDDTAPTLVARDRSGRRQWVLPLPFSVLQSQAQFGPRSASPQLHFAGASFALSFGTNFVVFDLSQPDATPQLLWQKSLLSSSGNSFLQTSVSVRVEYMKSGRRRVRTVENDVDQQVGQLIGMTSDAVYYQVGTRLIAADPADGEVLWIRYDVPQQAEATVDDQTVVLLDTISQVALVYRAADGELLSHPAVADPHQWVWYQGANLLTLGTPGNVFSLQYIDLLTGQPRWSLPLSPSAHAAVVQGKEVASLDSDGSWRVLDLATGQELSSGTVGKLPQLDFLWVQPERDGYLAVAGSFTPPGQGRHVIVFDGSQVPVTGAVFRFGPAGKQPDWSHELEPTAFHVIQSPSVPILAFSGKVGTRPQAGSGENLTPTRLSAVFIDRRTGDVIYETDEAPPPGMYQFEVHGEEGRLTANFLAFEIDLRDAANPPPAPGQ